MRLNLLTSLMTATTILTSVVPASILSFTSPAKATSYHPAIGRLPLHGWAKCTHDRGGDDLFITTQIYGHKGRNVRTIAHYPKAHGNKSASETYDVRQLSHQKASGRYVYHDANPAVGPTGKRGVWTGSWTMFFRNDGTFRLYRADDASGWRGSYNCRR